MDCIEFSGVATERRKLPFVCAFVVNSKAKSCRRDSAPQLAVDAAPGCNNICCSSFVRTFWKKFLNGA